MASHTLSAKASNHTNQVPVASFPLLARWQTPFSALPPEIVKKIMLWTATSDLIDYYPEIERPQGHSILPIMLTSKQFYQEISELIYEKQAFNIYIDGSKSAEPTHKYSKICLKGFKTLDKEIAKIPWHLFRRIRFHLKPNTSRPGSASARACAGDSAAEEHELYMSVVLMGFAWFCSHLTPIWKRPFLRGPTRVEVLCYEADGTLAASGRPPTGFPEDTSHRLQWPCWSLHHVSAIVDSARMLRDPVLPRMQCLCTFPEQCRQREPRKPAPAWLHDPRPEVHFRLPKVAYIRSAWHPISDEEHARYHCEGVLRRAWDKRSEMGIIEDALTKAHEQVVSKEDEELVSRLGMEAVRKADDAEIELQRRNYQKWLEHGDAQGDVQCLLLGGLRLAAAEIE